MADPPAIRRARRADLPALVELHRRYCAFDEHVVDEDAARAGFGPLLDGDEHGVVWVLLSDGSAAGASDDATPTGYAVVTWGWSIEGGGPEALLDEIYVDARGAGLGSRLLDHLLDDCRRQGMRRVFLETEPHNERARSLYLRHGFAVESSVWMSREL